MSEHTAGPWRIEGPYSRKGLLADQPRVYYWAIEAGADVSGTRVADVYESPKGRADRENANARLIAAAPELLEALEKIATYEPASFIAETDITAGDYAYAFGYVQQAAKSALAKIQRES